MRWLCVLFALFFSNVSLAYAKAEIDTKPIATSAPPMIRFNCIITEAENQSELSLDANEMTPGFVPMTDADGKVLYVAGAYQLFSSGKNSYIIEVRFSKSEGELSTVLLSKLGPENIHIFSSMAPLSGGNIGLVDDSESPLSILCTFTEIPSL